MQLIITRKANAIIKNLNTNEKTMYEYIVELIKQDNDHIQKCETEKYFHDDKEHFNKAISHQLNLSFRAKYIIQILGLYLYDDIETKTITVKARNDN
jgi:hypothetical protein